MIINIITNLSININQNNDINIIRLLIRCPPHDIKLYDYKHTSIRNADLTIYLDYINSVSIYKPGKHVLITDNTTKDYIKYYVHKLDVVYCKTEAALDYYTSLPGIRKIHYLGWSMTDKLNNEEFKPKTELSYYTYATEKNINQLLQLVEDWPLENTTLNVYSKLKKDNDHVLDLITLPNINFYMDRQPIESIFIQLNSEDFGYELLEEASTGSILITNNTELVRNSNGQFIWKDYENLLKILRLGVKDVEKSSRFSRQIFLDNQYTFLETFTRLMTKLFKSIIEKEPITIQPVIENKPLVSIITPTYNRSRFFKIALFVWSSLTYENREWIIVDDGDERLELPEDSRIKYIKLGERHTIGKKRNIAVENSSGDYIFCMDDDDFYPANVIERRLSTIGASECSYASTIACYNLFKRISFINSPNIYDLPHKRVSEATLFFKRSFWQQRGFGTDSKLGEGERFIEGRYDKCKELDWVGIIVSIIHTDNISSKTHPVDEPNGNHFINNEFGMTEDFVKLLERI